jgi:hypothetical protein
VVGGLKGRGRGRLLLFSGQMQTVWLGIFDMKSGMIASLMAAQCLCDFGVEL